jgi:hypothetical protein
VLTAASAAAVACIATWETDFRADLRKIDVPVLVVQGDADQAVPFEKTSKRVSAALNEHDVPPRRRHRPVAQEVTLNQDASRLPVRGDSRPARPDERQDHASRTRSGHPLFPSGLDRGIAR